VSSFIVDCISELAFVSSVVMESTQHFQLI